MPLINKHETLLDFVVKSAGSVAGLFDVALLNGNSITDDIAAGTQLKTLPVQLVPGVAFIPPAVVQPRRLELKKHQSLADYSTQYAGSVEAWFALAQLNGLRITDEVADGTVLAVDVLNQKTVDYFIQKGVDVVSAKKASEIKPGGIGYMQIQNDFKVS